MLFVDTVSVVSFKIFARLTALYNNEVV